MDEEESLGMDFGVLITSISKKIPLLLAVRNAAHKIGSLSRVHGSDSDKECVGQYAHAIDAFWHSASLERLKAQDILAYCQTHRLRAIIPTRDADLAFYAKHLLFFQSHGISIMVSPLESIEICQDKWRFSQSLAQDNLLTIPTSLSIGGIRAPAYVVKERYGSGSAHLGINLTVEKALKHAEELKHPIFQPFIEGKEWSIDLYRTRAGKVLGCVCRSRDLVIGGESQITTTKSYPALEKLALKIACHLNLYGHAIIQVIEEKTGNFAIVECNPRFGGASTASIAVGLDSFYWFMLESTETVLSKGHFVRTKQEVRQVRYPADWILPWS